MLNIELIIVDKYHENKKINTEQIKMLKSIKK